MTVTNEEEVRALTGWKAFKEGKSLADAGAVRGFKQRGKVLTGAFKSGRRTLRTVVRTGQAVSVDCGCEENRATGAVCAHAVALLLESLRPTSAPPVPEETPVSGIEAAPIVARRVIFPDSFAKHLGEGKAHFRIEEVPGGPAAGDRRLADWLGRAGSPGTGIFAVRQEELPGFLKAITGHEKLVTESGRVRLRVIDDPMAALDLDASERRGGRVTLKLSQAESGAIPVRCGDALWLLRCEADQAVLGSLPVAIPNPVWRDEAADLIACGFLKLEETRFLRDIDAWLDLVASPAPGWLGGLRIKAAEPEFRLELEGSLNALDATLSFRYFQGEFQPVGSERELSGLPQIDPDGVLRSRNRPGEAAAAGRLRRFGFVEAGGAGEFRLRDAAAILDLVADGLPGFRKTWQVEIGPRFAHQLKSVHVIRPRIGMPSGQSLTAELSFQTDGGKDIPGSKVREMLRAGRRSTTTSNGARVIVSRQVGELVEPLLADLGIVHPEGRIQLDQARARIIRNLRENLHGERISSDFDTIKVPENIAATLRDYQSDGFSWLNDRLKHFGGALLADEMGLGKTLQTIACLERLRAAADLRLGLILVPTTLLGNWTAELARFAPKLRFLVLHGANRDALRAKIPEVDCVLTSYGTLARDLAFHLRTDYDLVVTDEASLLRNPDSEISRAVAKIESPRRIALTGTPVENRLEDLWAIFRFVAPGYLGAKKEFLERYESADSGPASLDRLRLRISPYVLRRTKAEVAKDLPEKIEVDEWLDLGREARSLYASLARGGLEEFEEIQREQGAGAGSLHMLTLLLRLRQLCLDPALLDADPGAALEGVKSSRLRTLLEERADDGKKTLVFSQFRGFLRRFEKSGNRDCGKVFLLDGATRNRGELVEKFQNHDGPAVFLISLKAGGYGLNLTAADAVVHMDPWWNPAIEAQASDRAHRIGQTEPVTVYRLLTRDTVEERVRRLQASKQSLIDRLQAGESSIPAGWTESDLRSLVG